MAGGVPLPEGGVLGLSLFVKQGHRVIRSVNSSISNPANLQANVVVFLFIRQYSKIRASLGLGQDFKEESSYFR